MEYSPVIAHRVRVSLARVESETEPEFELAPIIAVMVCLSFLSLALALVVRDWDDGVG